MKKAVVILFVCGLCSLIVGSVLAIPSVRSKLPFVTIPSTGIIGTPNDSPSEEASLPQQMSDQTSLDIIGYFTILASIGFFATGLFISRKRD